MGESNGAAVETKTPTDIESQIIYQVEYYFGDHNLPRDKFLQEKIKEDDGFVTLEVLLTFNRLKSLSEDSNIIVEALRKSTSGLLEISEDGSKVRRSTDHPLPENTKEHRDEINNKTIYCKGFPMDSTFDKLKKFLEEYGKIDNLFLRRNGPTFKGSVFATFNSKDDCDKFLAVEGLKYEETELIKLLKQDYVTKKTEEKRKTKLENAQQLKNETAKEFQNNVESIKERLTKGAILHLEGFEGDVSREDIRNFFQDFANVAWVDYNPGDAKGQVRFNEENKAQIVLDKAKEANGGKLEVAGQVLEGRVLEGDEEVKHWQMIFSGMGDKNKRKPMKRGRGKFGSFKGKRRSTGDEDGPKAKAAKTE